MLPELISQEIDKAIEALLGDRPGGTITRPKLQHVLETMAHHVAVNARNDALLSLKSSQEVAELYHVSRQSIATRARRIRDRRGSFGWELVRGWWVFTPEEVEELRPGPAGRPKSKD